MPAAAIIASYSSSLLRRACGSLASVLLLACFLCASSAAQTITLAPPYPTQAPHTNAQNPAPAQQKPAPVTTTVIVHGEVEDNYLPESVTVGTLGGEPLKEAPLSATVVTRDLLSDQVSRLLSDVIQNDASVGDDYVPVGYYGDYQIRGFPIDLATGLEVNGMTIAGEQDVPLENKQSVEFLKGIAAVESGVAYGRRPHRLRDQAPGQHRGCRSCHRSSRHGLRRCRSRPSLRQPQAGGRAPESCRRKNRPLHERHQSAGAPWARARPTGS